MKHGGRELETLHSIRQLRGRQCPFDILISEPKTTVN